MNKIFGYSSNLIEQVTFSGFRYLFWISVPFLFSDSLIFISKLTLINLLNITIYSTLVGTPSFYLLSKKNKLLNKSFLPINIVILFVSLLSILSTYFFLKVSFFSEEFIIIGLFIYASSLSDWNRKISILKEDVRTQSYKNIISILVWCCYLILVYNKLVNTSFLFSTFIFLSMNIFVHFNYSYLKFKLFDNYLEVFESANVLKQYFTVSIIAYLSGNLIFYFLESNSLSLFIIFRNYLTPITVISLFIETHGALDLKAKNKQLVFFNQFLLISLVSILILIAVGLFLYFFTDFFDLILYLFASITTFLVAIIKIPTVLLRLNNYDFLITKVYLYSLLILLPALIFNNMFVYQGIELITCSYLFIFLYLTYHSNNIFELFKKI
jgi:hypothetical protein